MDTANRIKIVCNTFSTVHTSETETQSGRQIERGRRVEADKDYADTEGGTARHERRCQFQASKHTKHFCIFIRV